MARKFDYDASMAKLEEIVARVEDPETALKDIGPLVEQSAKLIEACRNYLRELRDTVKEQE